MTIIPKNSIIKDAQPRFVFSETIPVRRLAGFKKHHRVPTVSSSAALSFIGQLVTEELNSEFQQIHRLLRSHFGLKRTEIEVTLDDDGTAAIVETNLLRLEKRYSLALDTTDTVQCQIVLDSVKDLNLLSDPAFEGEFPFHFNELNFSPGIELDIERLIDQLEAWTDHEPGFELDYDFQATQCEIQVLGLDSALTFRADDLSLVAARPRSGPQLIQDFAVYQKVLQDAMSK